MLEIPSMALQSHILQLSLVHNHHANLACAEIFTIASTKVILVSCFYIHRATDQIAGYFDVPVDNLFARPLLQRYITQNINNYKEAVIVSPDAGGAKRATAIADSLGTSQRSSVNRIDTDNMQRPPLFPDS